MAVGADAGIVEASILEVSFGHNIYGVVTIEKAGQQECLKVLMGWTAPAPGIDVCQNVVVTERHMRGAAPVQITTIGLDLAKNWFQVHGVDAAGNRHPPQAQAQ